MPARAGLIEALRAERSGLLAELLARPSEEPPDAAVVGAVLDAALDALAGEPPRAPAADALEPVFAGRELADGLDEACSWIAAIRRLLVARVQALAASAADAGAAVLQLLDVCDALADAARTVLRSRLRSERAAAELEVARGRALFERTPAMMFAVDRETRIVAVSDRFAATLGYTREELLGRRSLELATEESRRRAIEYNLPQMREHGFVHDSPMQLVTKTGEVLEVLLSSAAFTGPTRDDVQMCTALFDITDRLRAVAHERTIAAQDELLLSLSAPLVPLGEGVLAVPIVGRVTPERAERILAALAEGVVEQSARIVLLDVTGMPEADAAVAAAIVRAAQAIRLLGARVVLSGVRPAMAQTLAALEVDLRGLTTLATLRDGIAYAAAQARQQRARRDGA